MDWGETAWKDVHAVLQEQATDWEDAMAPPSSVVDLYWDGEDVDVEHMAADLRSLWDRLDSLPPCLRLTLKPCERVVPTLEEWEEWHKWAAARDGLGLP